MVTFSSFSKFNKFLRKLWVGSYITEFDVGLKEWRDFLSQIFKIYLNRDKF